MATASPSSGTFPYIPFSMKMVSPPPHVLCVGFEFHQQGQAAAHEQASSSSPEIFQAFFSAAACGSAPDNESANKRLNPIPSRARRRVSIDPPLQSRNDS